MQSSTVLEKYLARETNCKCGSKAWPTKKSSDIKSHTLVQCTIWVLDMNFPLIQSLLFQWWFAVPLLNILTGYCAGNGKGSRVQMIYEGCRLYPAKSRSDYNWGIYSIFKLNGLQSNNFKTQCHCWRLDWITGNRVYSHMPTHPSSLLSQIPELW